MSAFEFGMWINEYQCNPWGEVRADLRAALISQTVTNMAGKQMKPGVTSKLSDFLLFKSEQEPAETITIEQDPLEHFREIQNS